MFYFLLLFIHSLYILALLRLPPPNLFSALRLPINAPLPQFERLELRALYVRFGHNVIFTCEHCRTFEDYALYALPRPALAYLREIALVGLFTLEKLNRSHLRPLGVGILVAAFVTETYLLATAPISIPAPNVNVRVDDTYMVRGRVRSITDRLTIIYSSGTTNYYSIGTFCSWHCPFSFPSFPLSSSTSPATYPSRPCS